MLQRESSGDYSAINGLHYAGGYQFGALALEDRGLLKPGTGRLGNRTAMNNPDNWTGRGGATDLDSFLANEALQDELFVEHHQANRRELTRQGFFTENTSEEDKVSFTNAAHLLGATKLIEGGLESEDANGTKGREYFDIGSSAYASAQSDPVQDPVQASVQAPVQAPVQDPVQDPVQALYARADAAPAPTAVRSKPQPQPERRAGAPGTPGLVGAYPTRVKGAPTYNPAGSAEDLVASMSQEDATYDTAGVTPNPIQDLYAKVDVAPAAETQAAALPEEEVASVVYPQVEPADVRTAGLPKKEVVPAGYTKVDPTDVRAAGSNPVAALYARTGRQDSDEWMRPSGPAPIKAVTPSSYGETFERGLDAGLAGIRTDTDYFKGIVNTLVGDDEAAAINIQTARDREGRIAESMSGLENFEEFIDNPTLGGLANQIFKTSGQLAPYVLTTIGTGGAAAAVGMIGKGVLTVASRQVAKKVIRDSIERSIKKEATRSEQDLAELAYRLARRTTLGKTARAITPTRAAIVGQLGEEFTLQAGANFGENLDIEGLSPQQAALRALTVAAPQAVLGVTGERIIQGAIFDSLGRVAKERAVAGSGSLLWGLGKEIAKATGRGTVGESITEGVQEGLQVASVMEADPTYAKEDALMRLAESFFAGAIGGGAMAGAGRTATGALELSGGVIGKAGEFIERAREQQVGSQFEQQQYGVTGDGTTTQEPKAHINAQIRSLTDPKTSRNSVWIAGNKPEYDASPDSVKQVEIGGERFYTKFIPGRGTIISKDYDVAEAVANDAASDASLQVALGYSNTKPVDADVVVEAREAPTEVGGKGSVVWAEATNEAGLAAAWAAAEKQVPEGGSVGRQSVEAALEERARLVKDESGPQVRNIDVPDDVRAEFQEDDGPDAFDATDPDDPTDFSDVNRGELVDKFAPGVEVQEAAQFNNVGRQEKYIPRDPAIEYDSTAAARQEFSEAFSDLDMEELGKNEFDPISFEPDSPFATMPDSFMRQAAQAQNETGGSTISPQLNNDGTWSLMQTVSPEADVFSFDSRTDTLVDSETEAQLDAAERRATIDAREEVETTTQELLSQVKGIGSKIIARVRKNMTVTQLLNAVADNDVGAIRAIPGIGKKTAERIISGLKDVPRPDTKPEVQSEPKPINSIRAFVDGVIKKAKQSRYARQKFTKKGWVDKTKDDLVTINGQAVNLVDLVKDGQRLFSNQERVNFTEGGNLTAQRNGTLQILSALIAEGYDIRIGGYSIRSAQLKQLNDLVNSISNEEAAIAQAVLEWDVDPDDPQLMGRLAEMQQALAEINESKARVNSPLDRLKLQRKEWAQKFQAYMTYLDGRPKDKEGNPILESDPPVTEPKKPPLLALMDVEAGFEGGKVVTLGKLLNVTPIDPLAKDTQYQLVNEDGFVVVEGNKQVAQERLEESGQPYIINKLTWNNVTKEMDVTRLSDEEFAAERNVGFNERTEDMAPDTPVADQSEDTMGSMQYSEDTTDGSPDYTFNPEHENVGNLKGIGLKAGTLAAKVANIARRTLGLKNPISVISVNELLDSASVKKLADLEKQLLALSNVPDSDSRKANIRADITTLRKKTEAAAENAAAYFGDPKVAQYVIDVARELIADAKGGGRYIGFGDAHIVLIDADVGRNALDTALIVSHELGHALYKEQLSSTLQNRVLYNRLFRDFQKARDAKGAPAAYNGQRGFEEWYADQAATWAVSEYKRDREKGLVGAHFQKVVRALKRFHKALSVEMQKRFGKDAYSPNFDGYMAEVLKRRTTGNTNSGASAATMQQKIIVRKMAEVMEKERPGFVGAIEKQAIKIIRSENFTPIYNFLVTADSRLRKVASHKMADMFYGRAQESTGRGRTKLGFLKTAPLEAHTWFSKLERALSGKLDSPEVKAAITEAFTSTPTRDLDGDALVIRQWFDKIYDEYIEPSNTDIGRQRDYAPVVLKLSEVESNPEGFVALLLQEDPEADPEKIKTAVSNLVNYQQTVMQGKPITVKETDPAKSVEKVIELTRNMDRAKLAEFLEDPDVALLRYLNHVVKRVEWNRHTKDNKGNSIYEEELKKLTPAQRDEAEKIVHKYLGYTDGPLPPYWQAANSIGTVVQIVAILPLAVLGSLPELAGPVIVSKEFGALQVGFKEILNTVRNRAEARSLAEDIGVVTSQSVANSMMSQSELEWMGDNARKFTNGFFRVIGLDTFTKFTREFSANMGVKFLLNHSNPQTTKAFSARWLKELGVTAEEVQTWNRTKQDFDTPEGRKVRLALQRFVESSTLRPNAAERPLWASDPRWALAWQLKGFFFSYGKVMLAGAKREAAARLEGTSGKDVNTYAAMTGAAGVFALMGVATMPLAMLGMELREYAKFGLAWAIPGIDHEAKNYFRTDDLTWSQYFGASFDRSYAAGWITIGSQAMKSMEWGRGLDGAAAVIAGPTAETIHRAFTEGVRSTVENRISPTGLL